MDALGMEEGGSKTIRRSRTREGHTAGETKRQNQNRKSAFDRIAQTGDAAGIFPLAPKRGRVEETIGWDEPLLFLLLHHPRGEGKDKRQARLVVTHATV